MNEAVNTLEREIKRIIKDLEFAALSYETDFKSRYHSKQHPTSQIRTNYNQFLPPETNLYVERTPRM